MIIAQIKRDCQNKIKEVIFVFESKTKNIYTIDDVARELGVSKSTVSRAISGKGRLSAETRSRILKFIEEHDFHPNAVAKSLAQSRTYNIGMIVPGDCDVIESAFFHECMEGCCEVAAKNDYDVLIVTVTGQDVRQLERILRNHKVDGVIVTRSTIGSAFVTLLQKKKIPYVVIGTSPNPDVPCVDNDNESAAKEMTSILLAKGMKKIALLGGNESYYVTHGRRRGFESAHIMAEVPFTEKWVFLNIDTQKKAAQAVDDALCQGVDCIICMDDYICSMALIRLREKNIRIPQDIRVACFYDSPILRQFNPPITGLHFDTRELGRMSCQNLLDQLMECEVTSCTRIGYQVILRESTN